MLTVIYAYIMFSAYWSQSQYLQHGDQAVPLLDEESRKFIEETHLLIQRERLRLLDIIGQGRFEEVAKKWVRNIVGNEK